jgi:hypothetical protein
MSSARVILPGIMTEGGSQGLNIMKCRVLQVRALSLGNNLGCNALQCCKDVLKTYLVILCSSTFRAHVFQFSR